MTKGNSVLNKDLLFIVSQPRSGSTLLQRILSSSPKVDTSSESWLLLPLLSLFKGGLNYSLYNSEIAQKAIQEFLNERKQNKDFEKGVAKLISNTFFDSSNEDVKYFLDKTPRYYEIMDLIPVFFPDAKIIILKRHPLDVLTSIVQTWNVKKVFDLYPYYRDLIVAPSLINEFEKNHKGSPKVRTVYYEDLVTQSNFQIRELTNWLEIPDLEQDHIGKNEKLSNRIGDQFSDGKRVPFDSSIDCWKQLVKSDRKWFRFVRGYAKHIYDSIDPRYQENLPTPSESRNVADFIDFCELKIPDSTAMNRNNIIKSLWLKLIYPWS